MRSDSYNLDGYLDVVLAIERWTGATAIELYRNEGGLNFTLVTDTSISDPANEGAVQSLSWGDANGDGFPDLLVGKSALATGSFGGGNNELHANQAGTNFTHVRQMPFSLAVAPSGTGGDLVFGECACGDSNAASVDFAVDGSHSKSVRTATTATATWTC